ncbi:MAG TPA: formyl transferase [Rhizobiaceae bacterium]|nr:formyl transferase [Rhizobiaceae bacterium]
MVGVQTRIVAITAGGHHPAIVLNALMDQFGPFPVLLEQPEDRSAFLRRRAARIGWVQVAGQFPMMMWSRFGKRLAARRIEQIRTEHGLSFGLSPKLKRVPVPSVNSDVARAHLRALAPEVVFVVGARMIGKATLSCIGTPFINYHAGINPAYRGQNGGYFALASGDAGNFGATVHLIDEGVDTGAVLYQQRVTPQKGDSILTYPYLLAAKSRGICVKAVSDALESNLRPVKVGGPSRQWYHPTVWGYVWTGLVRGVW